MSVRSDEPCYEINLAGMPEELAMTELFGAKRSHLSDGTNRIGLVQKADRGTLFIEGIKHAGPVLQLALWRLVNAGSFSPLGGQELLTSNPRPFVGASIDLARCVAEGGPRPDLYFGLAVAEIDLPSLRARRGNGALLAVHLLSEHSARHSKPVHDISAAALELLENYDWPAIWPGFGTRLPGC